LRPHANLAGMSERTTRFAAGLAELLAERSLSAGALASAAGMEAGAVDAYLAGGDAAPQVSDMARMCLALKLDPLDFLHRCGLFTDVDYAMGLDPLFFLNEGGVRAMMRITLRERFNNPKPIEGEHVIRRNTVIRALQDDRLIDDPARIELQMRYLLLAANNAGGGVDLYRPWRGEL
jgi:transcriptional regulator with XRE-family HTH domain